VIADSSTEAMPSTISPSLAMTSPASTRMMSPGLRVRAETSWNAVWSGAVSRFALVSVVTSVLTN